MVLEDTALGEASRSQKRPSCGTRSRAVQSGVRDRKEAAGAGARGGAGVRVEGDRVPVWEGEALERLVMTAPDSVTVSDATELYI